MKKRRHRTLRACCLCNKLPTITRVRAPRTGRGCLHRVCRAICLGSILRHGHLGGSSKVHRLIHLLTSAVNSYAGIREVSGAFGSIKKIRVNAGAVNECLRGLRSSFVVDRTLHCSIGKHGCVNANAGCCFRSVNVEGTIMSFQRVRFARVVRGIICGRLQGRNCAISIKSIRDFGQSRGNGLRHEGLRVSFIIGHRSRHLCVRSTCTLPSGRGMSRRRTSLLGMGSNFHGLVVMKSECHSNCGRRNVLVVDLSSFLLKGR